MHLCKKFKKIICTSNSQGSYLAVLTKTKEETHNFCFIVTTEDIPFILLFMQNWKASETEKNIHFWLGHLGKLTI